MNSGLPSAVSSTRTVVSCARPRARLPISASPSASEKRLESKRARIRPFAEPVRSLLEELRAGDADEEDRRFPGPLREVLDQVEERGLRPVNVLEEDDQRTAAGQRREESPRRPEDLLALDRGLRAADRLQEGLGERLRLCPSESDWSGAPAVSWATISRSDQKVMPSPYGTHRPTTTVACSAASAANSCASRDLPIPAVPRIVNRCSLCSSAHARERLLAAGQARDFGRPAAPSASQRRTSAPQLDDAPGASGSRRDRLPVAVSRSSRSVSSPRRISPASAASSSSPAAITGSPTASPRRLNRSPRPPRWRSRSVARARDDRIPTGASRISNAAATARDASSSWACGPRRPPSPRRRGCSRPLPRNAATVRARWSR